MDQPKTFRVIRPARTRRAKRSQDWERRERRARIPAIERRVWAQLSKMCDGIKQI